MPNEEWGVKRLCPETGKRFYDLNKDPIINPYTGEVFELENSKSRTIKPDSEDAETKKSREKEAASKDETLDDDDDDDADVDLGDDVLDDDDDDDDKVSLEEIADVPAEGTDD